MEEITIVVCSTHDKTEKEDFCKNVQETCGVSNKLLFLINRNGVGLSQIYHNMISSVPTDIVIFIHDDIEFLRYGWGKEIVRLFNEHKDYGIIGVAGSSEFYEMGAWWQYKKVYGQVLHRNENKSWLSAFSDLLDKDLEEVCVIDGLFIAVRKDRIKSNFDKNLPGFHMYDIDFCLSNFITKEVKIGVTTNIRLAHNSIGELDEKWYQNREIINNKYKDYYPIKL